MPILIARNIHKYYRLNDTRLHILKGVNLELDKGEVVALRGPSGSGKSTLLNILGSLDRPDEGEVIIGGKIVHDLDDEALARFRNRHIGFIFQFHHLLPELNLIENLELPLHLSEKADNESRHFVLELLKITGLTERTNHFPSQLSGGERQRAAVIRALVNRPGIVFADEPTGNLDQENGAVIVDLLRRLCNEMGQTFLVGTHSQRVANAADRIITLDAGLVNVT